LMPPRIATHRLTKASFLNLNLGRRHEERESNLERRTAVGRGRNYSPPLHHPTLLWASPLRTSNPRELRRSRDCAAHQIPFTCMRAARPKSPHHYTMNHDNAGEGGFVRAFLNRIP
jgi:hypothetical protein